jgi:hypothetical protein
VHDYLASMGQTLDATGLTILAQVVDREATVQAYINTFWLIAASFVAMLPLLLLIHGTKPRLPGDETPEADAAHLALE